MLNTEVPISFNHTDTKGTFNLNQYCTKYLALSLNNQYKSLTSIARTTSIPSISSPNTTCLPSS